MSRFDALVEVKSEEVVRGIAPDFAALQAIEVRGVIVTARSDSSEFDFVSRFFGPRVGVPEDPVTGSAHCVLAPYWAEKLGRTEMVGYQASKRGGVVRVRLEGDRVLLGGQAITVLRGELVGSWQERD
jgi:PhzF family phenazine biosynthesis protein